MKTHEEAVRAKESVEGLWLRLPGVTAIDVGAEVPSQGAEKGFVIRVYVESLAEALRDARLPKEVGGVKVVLIERRFRLH